MLVDIALWSIVYYWKDILIIFGFFILLGLVFILIYYFIDEYFLNNIDK